MLFLDAITPVSQWMRESLIVSDLEIAITSLSFASLLLCKLVAMEIEQTYSGGWSWKNAKTS